MVFAHLNAAFGINVKNRMVKRESRNRIVTKTFKKEDEHDSKIKK